MDNTNTATHPRNPPVEVKMDAVHRCLELGESIKYVPGEIGYSRASIYAWRKKYLQGGTAALVDGKNIKPSTLVEGTQDPPNAEMQHLLARMDDMLMEIGILKETINVLKKGPGINTETLKNRGKAAVVDALKGGYPLPLLLKRLKLPKSSYDYQETALKKQGKYSSIRKRAPALSHENNGRYGYRRIHALASRGGTAISGKAVRRTMAEEGLAARVKGRRNYNPYQGETSPSVPNMINRDFHAEKPDGKWLTDITEFATPAGKVYLSPIVGCFDGMLPYWTASTAPDAGLVNGMLDGAISQLGVAEHPVVHSGRGCHYRWPGWTSRMGKAGLGRSMPQKGCPPDNSACGGLFGRLKNGMFYNRDWRGVSIQGFIDIRNEYLIWYNEKRIKVSLGNMSPLEYRKSLGLAA